MAPAAPQVAPEVVVVLWEHKNDVVGGSIFQETGISESYLSVERGCLQAAMHPEMHLTFVITFQASIWIVDPAILIKTIVLKHTGFVEELLLSELRENAPGLPIVSPGF